METRRSILISFLGAAAMAGSASAATPPPVEVPGQPGKDGLPQPVVLPGTPPVLDYGSGVKVPADKHAFLTLWEADSFWLTFGFGAAPRSDQAKSLAVHHAEGAMKYLLLTLAFAPDRLTQGDGHGWHQKVEDPQQYVVGDLDLPGTYSLPLTDAGGRFGSTDQSNLGGVTGTGSIGQSSSMPGAEGMGGFNPAMMLGKMNAFCAYVVKKSDLSLDDVRKRAKNVDV